MSKAKLFLSVFAVTAALAALPAAAQTPLKVDPGKPFGDMKITEAASLAPHAIADWVKKLPAAQQTELEARCDYVAGHEGEFKVDDLGFCQQWQYGRSPDLAN